MTADLMAGGMPFAAAYREARRRHPFDEGGPRLAKLTRRVVRVGVQVAPRGLPPAAE